MVLPVFVYKHPARGLPWHLACPRLRLRILNIGVPFLVGLVEKTEVAGGAIMYQGYSYFPKGTLKN